MKPQQTVANAVQQRRFWLALLFAVSMLGLQGLGQWHRVLHPHGSATLTAKFVLGHEAGSADCQLFDHIAQGDGLCSAATPSSGVIAAAPQQALPSSPFIVRTGWHVQARGPPLSLG
ncbi:hypothetical protein RQP53_05455 [Paucibacter sp. APW11]|uniref:DUF2946 domain-containing protein n=1 Tax=Roseateles aquae TaxID=3077235 RepID=A0ABU3P832_9BURK|nr:hypothetical protein [Paucibacter sp. APW11]MDT8998712.1 hypothetical protein [Paucibacter sp. APW11]